MNNCTQENPLLGPLLPKKLRIGQLQSGIIVPRATTPWKIPTYNYSQGISGLFKILEILSTDALGPYETRKFHYYLETSLTSKLLSVSLPDRFGAI